MTINRRPPLDLNAMEERVSAATAGPWRTIDPSRGAIREANGYSPSYDAEPDDIAVAWSGLVDWRTEADATFIAHARADMPALIEEVHRLRAIVDVGGVVHDSNMDSTALKRAKADAWDEGREAMGDDIQREIWDGIDERTKNPYREQADD